MTFCIIPRAPVSRVNTPIVLRLSHERGMQFPGKFPEPYRRPCGQGREAKRRALAEPLTTNGRAVVHVLLSLLGGAARGLGRYPSVLVCIRGRMSKPPVSLLPAWPCARAHHASHAAMQAGGEGRHV